MGFRAFETVVVGLVFFGASVACAAEPAATGWRAGFGDRTASADAVYAVDTIVRTGDNHRLPFAIVDKKAARLYVFDAESRLAGASSVLIGRTRGDGAGPTPGLRPPSTLPMADRTTPAGRFDSEPGHNDHGEAIVWVDYAASLAIHRLRPAPLREHRPERLASPNVDDKRISLGCVVVPVAFYARVVAPLLGKRRGVVYVLPDSRPVETLFENGDALALR